MIRPPEARLTAATIAVGLLIANTIVRAEPAPPPGDGPIADAVTQWYAELAHHRYRDALGEAERFVKVINAFLDAPGPDTHAAAKQAWIAAHTRYSHSEAYRFGNPNVDAWEDGVNAWPLDEGFIDYVVESAYVFDESNPHGLEDLIGTEGYLIDASFIEEAMSGNDPKEGQTFRFTDFESNVSKGFHAAEFLLWGQDLNDPPTSAGQRPWTDYAKDERCTNGRCDRRRIYLNAVARLLVKDLRFAIQDWNLEGDRLYGKAFRELTVRERLRRAIVALGNMSYGELAGERMRVALLASDQEDEQSCFSDTTHLAIYHNAEGIRTLYLGTHALADGTVVQGPSLSALVARLDPALDAALRSQLDETMRRASALVEAAEAGEPFDRLIRPENAKGRALIQALIAALAAQTESLESLLKRTTELAAL